ncbi:hypothetical protein A2865_02335 [Candidatus Woesebacteria bacterium RIFCSPHIGHO2_01_FULL_39_17]|uniref:ornithine decarboxylase n=2 Tax=Candidatus Woeseibacteriota TaxID=1752722 RepID=A0A0G0NCU2_9BACT|nr:MAG: Diaminopimelate decarboxylase [Microgenomates group bacterium GW2011_GWC1_38_12]KKQ93920.1 MAG: Diaminopimelate decarboxylase [Candidatus Woesebacteria bacterium GW2011_GWB1_39_10b]KKR13989.1 MAG: Diaminopimelate decarboxylase [Candidatus Woesebacteria bacterium GW2011_GWA1_39_21b]OGM23481.1 MAG: hypothetical protein A2865_02335 [Candidatus Woesebacteria bacterium RIFCSPHIGHO2_01_FULL_39_17]
MRLNKTFLEKLKKIKTPFIIYDLNRIRKNYEEIAKVFHGIDIYYAMKCNSHLKIINLLKDLGSGFEVASVNESIQLLKQNVSPTKIICMHPIKSPEFLKFLRKNNIWVMAADSYEEVDKISKYAPGSKVVARIAVDNEGSEWKLTGKFGIDVTEFPRFLTYIKSKKLMEFGLTFHVGSQCTNPANWVRALNICDEIWKEAHNLGMNLKFLSIGGGLAVKYIKSVPGISRIGKLVTKEIQKKFKTGGFVTLTMEPGRAVVANSGVLVTQVIGKAKRGLTNWLYIDVGTYNGLIEAIETPDRKFYPIVVENNNRKQEVYNIGGPSCVSLDTPFEEVILPKLNIGERIYLLNTGGYTVMCAAPFNGFDIPKEYIYQELKL